MKIIKLLSLLLLLSFTACKKDKPKAKINAITKTEQHYICLNKCENSGSANEGVCATCNTPYTHNAAFHKDDFMKNGPLNVPSNSQNPSQPINTNNAVPSPAQNAAGIFHYTCTNGCVGGAGSEINCKACGEKLVHNQAYHN
jgi:hypothetical protein